VIPRSGSFLWSGSLCRTVLQLPLGESAGYEIECCMLEPGEYKFVLLCTSLDKEEKVEQKCWSSHPAVVKVV
jgi:hypothetical protein